MPVRQVWQMQQVNGQPVVAPPGQPIGGLTEGMLVLKGYLCGVFFGAVDDDNHLGLAKRRLAVGQAFERTYEVRLVVAGDDDNHLQGRVWAGVDQPGSSRFL